ncbi:MAG: winged helix-turn-helix transcriptional regulator, partial [Ruminococcus sp.]|nr:winged helix-turn-helix transcriptional regulator [Ruminococcus sp.]
GTTTPTENREALNRTQGRVSAVLNALAKMGEGTRAIDKDNRRSILVTLTDSGKEHVMNELQSGYRTMTHILEELGEQDSREFIRMLTRVFKLMNETS